MALASILQPDNPARRFSVGALLILAIAYPYWTDVPEGVPFMERVTAVALGTSPNWVLMAALLLAGLWPIAVANILFPDERSNARWFFLAAFICAQTGSPIPILVYRFFLGRVHGTTLPAGHRSRWLQSRAHIILFSFLWIVALALLAFAPAPMWHGYLRLFRSERGIHLLTWNLFVWCAAYSIIAEDDLARRQPPGEKISTGLKFVLRIPLINVLVHLAVRPKLGKTSI